VTTYRTNDPSIVLPYIDPAVPLPEHVALIKPDIWDDLVTTYELTEAQIAAGLEVWYEGYVYIRKEGLTIPPGVWEEVDAEPPET
jgi:hypothetical protein